MSVPLDPLYFETPPRKPKKGRWWKVILIILGSIFAAIVAFFVIALIAIAIWGTDTNSTAASSAAAQKVESQKKLDNSIKELSQGIDKAVAEAAAKDRTAMEAAGWTYFSDYMYYAEPAGGYQCSGSFGCAQMNVTTTKLPNGCSRGIGISVSFFNDSDVSVNTSSRTTGLLNSGEQAALEFIDTSRQGTSYRVDSMKCYG